MKNYLNLFHGIIDKIHFWDDISNQEKTIIIENFVPKSKNNQSLLNYFENYQKTLKKNTLNSYIKSVSSR